MTGTAIKTDGIGSKTTSHLNLTTPMEPEAKQPNQWSRKPYAPILMMAKLRDAKGNWLHKDLTQFTIMTQDAWVGNRKVRDELYRARPEFRSLAVMPI